MPGKGFNDFEYRYRSDLADRYEQVDCKFKLTGKIPELWDPMTGEIRKINIYREEDGYTIIPLHFKPEGSQFIIFREVGENEPFITQIKKMVNLFFPGIFSKSGFFLTSILKRMTRILKISRAPDKYYEMRTNAGIYIAIVLLDRVSFDGEKIVLPDGMSYRILMFPDEGSIDENQRAQI